MDDAVHRAHRRQYSRRSVILNLLENYGGDWVRNIDLPTFEHAPGEVATDELRRHTGALLWRARMRSEGWMYLVVLLEFDPDPRRSLPARILAYAALAFCEAVRVGALGPGGKLPHVMHFPLYDEHSYQRLVPDRSELVAVGKELITYRQDRPQMRVSYPAGHEYAPLSGDMLPALTELERDPTSENAARVMEILDDWVWTPPLHDRTKLEYISWVAHLVTRRKFPVPFVKA